MKHIARIVVLFSLLIGFALPGAAATPAPETADSQVDQQRLVVFESFMRET